MIEEGTFGFKSNTLPLDKASYLLDMLEIGRRKYTEVRRLFLTENIHLPSFGKLSKHRCEVGLEISLNSLIIIIKTFQCR